MKKEKIENQRIVEIFGKKGCNVSATCIALGVSRKTFYEWKVKDKKLSEALDECEESLIDNVESKLLQYINEGDKISTIFFLKTKGKKRGYIESIDSRMSDANGNEIKTLNIGYAKNPEQD